MGFRKIFIAIKRKIFIIFDLLRNKDYLKTVYPEELGLDSSRYFKSSTCDNYYLKEVFNYIKIGKNDSIIDIGSGKGSALKFFLQYPFIKIGGLEISEKLIAISKRNLKNENQNILFFFNDDAKNFDRYDQFNIYYAYNPCGEEIFDGILEKIVNSASNKKYLIYNNPTCEELVIKSGFTFIKDFDSGWEHRIKLFSFTPDKDNKVKIQLKN